MNRHVIKGRGEHRGKYLCYARMAGRPHRDGYVWLPEQRKAARWEDPRYSGRTSATYLAAEHNGYFVKLVAPAAITKALILELREYIREHASCSDEELACHWFSSDFHDAGENFCRDCAEKLVDEKYAADPKRFEELYGECDDDEERHNAAIDGGFDGEHDSPPACGTCGARLSGNLTGYGADEEIEALTTDCVPTFNDADGWAELDRAIVNIDDDDPRWRRIVNVVEAARIAEQSAAEAAAALAATPGMSEARGGFLALLSARQEQKAPEPSFRLWDEFQAWMLVRHDETPESKATEKRLFKEAVCFLRFCGIRAYTTNGGMGMAEATHGTYYWPFIVETEQHKLWKNVDMAVGRAVGLACLDSEKAPGRDANPFILDGYDTPRARAWDNGFLLGSHEAGKRSRLGA